MKRVYELMLNYLKKKWWYCVLLVLSSLYVFFYRYDIYELSDLNAMNLIFITWLVLLLLPLLSEVEILGVKIKKEIEETKSEIKELGYQLTELKLSNNNSNVTNNYLSGPLPSKEELQKYSDKQVDQAKEKATNYSTDLSNEIDSMKSEVPQQSTYLFQIRYNLERAVYNLCVKNGYRRYPIMRRMLEQLKEQNLLSSEQFNLINNIISITNRGIHGEIVSNEYIEFIKSVYPDIHRFLVDALNQKPVAVGAYHQYAFDDYLEK